MSITSKLAASAIVLGFLTLGYPGAVSAEPASASPGITMRANEFVDWEQSIGAIPSRHFAHVGDLLGFASQGWTGDTGATVYVNGKVFAHAKIRPFTPMPCPPAGSFYGDWWCGSGPTVTYTVPRHDRGHVDDFVAVGDQTGRIGETWVFISRAHRR